MPTIQAALDIEAPTLPLFDLAQDYGLRLTWDPFLRELAFRDGATEAMVAAPTPAPAADPMGALLKEIQRDQDRKQYKRAAELAAPASRRSDLRTTDRLVHGDLDGNGGARSDTTPARCEDGDAAHGIRRAQ